MNESQIRECVERVLAAHRGELYSASKSETRLALGHEVFAEILREAQSDIEASALARESTDAASH